MACNTLVHVHSTHTHMESKGAVKAGSEGAANPKGDKQAVSKYLKTDSDI